MFNTAAPWVRRLAATLTGTGAAHAYRRYQSVRSWAASSVERGEGRETRGSASGARRPRRCGSRWSREGLGWWLGWPEGADGGWCSGRAVGPAWEKADGAPLLDQAWAAP